MDWLLRQPDWVSLALFPSLFALAGACLGWVARGLFA